MYQRCVSCAEYIRKTIGGFSPESAVVLGSGLGGFADKIELMYTVCYKDIPGFPISTAPGHNGRLLFGNFCGKKIAVAQGRVHIYEGYSAAETALPVRVLKLLGANTVILTNAAGGINTGFTPGDIMLIEDHIALFTESPLTGENIDEFGVRFPDMSEVYDKALRVAAQNAAKREGIRLKHGVYAQVKGPQYETPADIRALCAIGADAVGMSTVTEAIAARHFGMRVCAMSVITNMAAGVTGGILNHSEITEISRLSENGVAAIIGGITEEI